jgi:Secretion system C-terminal sorting domain
MKINVSFLPGIFLIANSAFAQHEPTTGINLQVSNVCEYYGQIIGCNPSFGSGEKSSMGNAGCVYSSNYLHYDSCAINNPIKYMSIDPSGAFNNSSKYLCVGEQNKILIYNSVFTTSNYCNAIISPLDTIYLDSIVSCVTYNNSIFVIRSSTVTPNYLVFESPFQVPVFSEILNMRPLMLEIAYNTLAVVGEDSNADVRVNILDRQSGVIMADTILPVMAANPKSVDLRGSYVYIDSSPGDTAITITRFNITSHALNTTTIHSNSGLNTGDWEYGYYHYQPLVDLSGNNDDKKVFRYDLAAMQPYATFNINKRLHKLIYAAGDYYYFMHAIEESPLNNHVTVYQYFNYLEVDSFTTTQPVDFIVSDFRCFVSVPEYDDHLVKIQAYPNPTKGILNIKASGLICGREYKMDLSDLTGKIYFEQVIHAKMVLEIPMQQLVSGVYLLRIHTKKGVVSEKIVKQ